MRLRPVRIEVRGDHAGEVTLLGDGPHVVGPWEVTVSGLGGRDISWSVANRGDAPVRLRGVRLIMAVEDVVGPLRLFRHGYQSWSPSGVATLGIDRDPSLLGKVPRLLRESHHADGEVAEDAELRSELVTVLADDRRERLLAGFLGGASHDGTLRLRHTEAAEGRRIEMAAEAYLGGARLDPGAERALHPITFAAADDASSLLEKWADRYGSVASARTTADYQIGWCSWYHYFGAVTEEDIRANLARAADWPFDVFQIDDGFQASIGDWLTTDGSFPSSLDTLADEIAAAGRRPGLWIAPFLAMPDSEVATAHPDWIARYTDGTKPLVGMWHPVWGGATHVLDTTNPNVVAHLETLGRDLVDAGYTYLKLDFTYAPAIEGQFCDPTRTPAERVRAGYDAVRAGAGDDAFLLGCGAPFGAVVGVVDANRVGPDVAPHWQRREGQPQSGSYAAGEPSTANAWASTLARSFQHRKLWVNDPDCLMLRLTDTEMGPDAVRAWADAVAMSGGMALVSDDLSMLDDTARRLLDDVIELGRAADAEAVAGRPPRCPDLLDHPVPERLIAAGRELLGHPQRETAELR
jgi:alpha-galactosidase